MTLELLVAGLCLGNYNCGDATKAYYQSQPQIKVMRKTAQSYATKYVAKELVIGVPIMYAMVTDKSYQVRLTKNWSIGRTEDHATMLRFRYDF